MSRPPSQTGSPVESIPEYLRPYIAQQDPSLYTPIDHAAWRFIMKIASAFFARTAHERYLRGLEETGISTESIPLISQMDAKLSRFGWRAIPVSGFIPPAVFMEFLSRGVLPIACDMRKLENIAYTPAPDIVHEAAGHAPILADPAFANYLRHYGEIAEKAIFSRQDLDVYNAIRCLSETKEDPAATPEAIAQAQRELDAAIAAVDHDSEATQLGRMGWWTFEYGLIGDFDDPKIYGAGLLSSVSESYHCLSDRVKKVPFSVDCVNQDFDITRPQPQLFVARDFQQLTEGLDQLAQRMAFRRGGIEGLEKARKAAAVTTTLLDTGLQISGVLSHYDRDAQGDVILVRYQGPVQLAFGGRELEGQGPEYHREGFSSPLGPLAGGRLPSELTEAEASRGRLEFASGIELEGEFIGAVRREGRNLLLRYSGCTVRQGQETLFKPEWGDFDLACGVKVLSVAGHAADRKRYLEATGGFGQRPGSHKSNLTSRNRELNALYAEVRAMRERLPVRQPDPARISWILDQLDRSYLEDWLLRYELVELIVRAKVALQLDAPLREALRRIASGSREKSELIGRGLDLLGLAP